MRFNLVDQILAIEPGRSIDAVKLLTLGEDYLADHFPTFPVMPGVLMLQTLVEAGSWLLRVTDDFQHSVIVLREAKNVKYGNFMVPGRSMRVTVEMVSHQGVTADLKGKGEMDGSQTVSARFTLGLSHAHARATDERLIAYWRENYATLRRGAGALAPVGL
jgi:3-hydroxyacyl-[acyl-carrier-protein] dehydratase